MTPGSFNPSVRPDKSSCLLTRQTKLAPAMEMCRAAQPKKNRRLETESDGGISSQSRRINAAVPIDIQIVQRRPERRIAHKPEIRSGTVSRDRDAIIEPCAGGGEVGVFNGGVDPKHGELHRAFIGEDAQIEVYVVIIEIAGWKRLGNDIKFSAGEKRITESTGA